MRSRVSLRCRRGALTPLPRLSLEATPSPAWLFLSPTPGTSHPLTQTTASPLPLNVTYYVTFLQHHPAYRHPNPVHPLNPVPQKKRNNSPAPQAHQRPSAPSPPPSVPSVSPSERFPPPAGATPPPPSRSRSAYAHDVGAPTEKSPATSPIASAPRIPALSRSSASAPS